MAVRTNGFSSGIKYCCILSILLGTHRDFRAYRRRRRRGRVHRATHGLGSNWHTVARRANECTMACQACADTKHPTLHTTFRDDKTCSRDKSIRWILLSRQTSTRTQVQEPTEDGATSVGTPTSLPLPWRTPSRAPSATAARAQFRRKPTLRKLVRCRFIMAIAHTAHLLPAQRRRSRSRTSLMSLTIRTLTRMRYCSVRAVIATYLLAPCRTEANMFFLVIRG